VTAPCLRLGLSLVAVAGALAVAVIGWAKAQPRETAPGDAGRALMAIDRQVAELDSREQSDKRDLVRLGEQVAVRHARVLTGGRAFYRLTRAGLLPVGGGFGALVSYAIQVERARRVLASDIDAETQLRGRSAQLARELEQLGRDRASLASQRAAVGEARAAMQDDQRRQLAFDRAFETSTGAASGYVAVYGGTALAPDTPAGGFASARGRLLLPVATRADVAPVRREGTEGPGLEIRAPAGTPVRSVFAGRVAFADRYGPYGRIVIIDHGDHYYTVSGNLNEIDVGTGQDVGVGERIGTVGDDGRGSMLYFEVRHGSHTVAPEPWLGLSSGAKVPAW
jgi:murein hydrolase activator